MRLMSIAEPLENEADLYPSSDGEPMAETELHGDEMTDLKLMLRRRFREQADGVYVGCNLFVYYERGNPRAVFSPDVFVVRGAPQKQYDTYKLWQDGPAPCWVIEVSSKKTYIEDRGNKKAVCEMLGVTEYFLYDPREEYLHPPLQGFRLRGGRYELIAPDTDGRTAAESLGLSFALGADGLIVVTDSRTGEPLPRPEDERDQMSAALNAATEEQERLKALIEAAEARAAAVLGARGS